MLFPIHDDNPTERFAVVTAAIIAINVVVFLLEPITASAARQTQFFFCHAAIPFEVVHRHALQGLEVLGCPHKSVVASLFASMFLHGGWLHIIGNMVFLWVFGNNVEDRLGRGKFLVFYFLCGLISTIAFSYIFRTSTQPLIGASGAVAGVLGAYLLLAPGARVTSLLFIYPIELPAAVVLLLWFVLQIFSGVGSVRGKAEGVAYMAHVAGFVAGMILWLAMGPRKRRPPAEIV